MPDGISFDAFGSLWITVINQNGLFVINAGLPSTTVTMSSRSLAHLNFSMLFRAICQANSRASRVSPP